MRKLNSAIWISSNLENARQKDIPLCQVINRFDVFLFISTTIFLYIYFYLSLLLFLQLLLSFSVYAIPRYSAKFNGPSTFGHALKEINLLILKQSI